MGGEIDDPHRTCWWQGAEHAAAAGLVDAEIAEGRDEAGDVVVEIDQPFFHQHQQGHAGDRLGHRVDAEDGVLADRRAALDIEPAPHAAMRQLATAPDMDGGIGNVACLDVLFLQHPVEPAQPLGGEPCAVTHDCPLQFPEGP